ncbi:unnamed protein product [Adineta steineri]|uniref:Uncharacterized protein n=1 Tax=Adineta steineri TaxID=433720 RepID=A0A818RVV5_9BILA|nr:unnamed protein product [Adineta steineri]
MSDPIDDIRLCFNNIAEHLHEALPQLIISAVFILGGKDESQFQNLQNAINDVVKTDVNLDHINKSYYYKDLFKNIIYNNTCFNVIAETPQITGECYIDVLVGKWFDENHDTVVDIQHVKKFL